MNTYSSFSAASEGFGHSIRFTHPALYNEETEQEVVLNLPARRIVCPTCNGYGHHFRTDLDENSFVREIREERDEEGWQMYLAGYFNQACSQCQGEKVIDSIDWEYFRSVYPNEAKEVSEWNAMQKRWEEEREWERRMGA